MMIWIVGVVLVLLAAAVGYFLGAVRTSICLVGAVLAGFLASTVGGSMGGVVTMIGYTNPVWQYYLPPVLGFLVVSIVFSIVAFVVHFLVERHLKNNSDDYAFARWERLNHRTGLAVGCFLAMVWLVLFGIAIYVPGYLVAQLTDENEASAGYKFLAGTTRDAESTGLIRIMEHFRPAAENHFAVSDILGLVYSNPALHSRLASYPPFLGLAEKPEIAELAKDADVNSMIQSRAGLGQIFEQAKIRAVADNPELVNELLGLDFADLHEYLKTGVSQKYKDEHILGRWRLNTRRSIAEMKMTAPDKLPAVEFNLLRKAFNVYLEDMTVGFTTDNKAILKVKAKDEQKLLQTVGRASAGSQTPSSGGAAGGGATPGDESGTPAPSGGGLSARSIAARAIPQQPTEQQTSEEIMRSRYGIGRPGAGGQRGQPLSAPLAVTSGAIQGAPAKAAPSTALGPLMSNGEGAWAKSGETYKLTISNGGKEIALDVTVKESQMTAKLDGRVLVFDRI